MRITRLGQGVDAAARARARGDRADGRPCSASTASALDRARRRPRCVPPRPARRATPRNRDDFFGLRTRRSASRPSCSRARRRPRCRSSARPPTSTAPGALPRRRHRRRLHRVRVRHRRARRARVARHGMRAYHRAVARTPIRPRPRSCQGGRTSVRELLADVAAGDPERCRRRGRSSGLAGTVTTIAAVEQGLPEYDPERIHHFRLTRGRGRGRVPHARHRVGRAARAQPRARGGPGRRHRRRRGGRSWRSCAARASTRCWSRSPTSSTAWSARCPEPARPGRARRPAPVGRRATGHPGATARPSARPGAAEKTSWSSTTSSGRCGTSTGRKCVDSPPTSRRPVGRRPRRSR